MASATTVMDEIDHGVYELFSSKNGIGRVLDLSPIPNPASRKAHTQDPYLEMRPLIALMYMIPYCKLFNNHEIERNQRLHCIPLLLRLEHLL